MSTTALARSLAPSTISSSGPDGRIIAAIIVVGGCLGIGEKEVALLFSSVQAARRDNDWQIVIDKAALKDAPTFEAAGERVRLKLSPKQ
jgi:hypothetical protein